MCIEVDIDRKRRIQGIKLKRLCRVGKGLSPCVMDQSSACLSMDEHVVVCFYQHVASPLVMGAVGILIGNDRQD
ncbi:hypothetical protein A0126_18330 (plasmid) [Exiguobacterium sp. N4-1P]|nr:hypothetical protein A0126_08065 [Exiguobacterium sp. N4-1P]ASI37526.1 hypothetical protein A0126_18330 [Exiguobacterium sp. N4-1P]